MSEHEVTGAVVLLISLAFFGLIAMRMWIDYKIEMKDIK
jgi:hypothetical protein